MQSFQHFIYTLDPEMSDAYLYLPPLNSNTILNKNNFNKLP